jgi:hypothetical protein
MKEGLKLCGLVDSFTDGRMDERITILNYKIKVHLNYLMWRVG